MKIKFSTKIQIHIINLIRNMEYISSRMSSVITLRAGKEIYYDDYKSWVELEGGPN